MATEDLIAFSERIVTTAGRQEAPYATYYAMNAKNRQARARPRSLSHFDFVSPDVLERNGSRGVVLFLLRLLRFPAALPFELRLLAKPALPLPFSETLIALSQTNSLNRRARRPSGAC